MAIMTTMISSSARTVIIIIAISTDVGNDVVTGGIVSVGLGSPDEDEERNGHIACI